MGKRGEIQGAGAGATEEETEEAGARRAEVGVETEGVQLDQEITDLVAQQTREETAVKLMTGIGMRITTQGGARRKDQDKDPVARRKEAAVGLLIVKGTMVGMSRGHRRRAGAGLETGEGMRRTMGDTSQGVLGVAVRGIKNICLKKLSLTNCNSSKIQIQFKLQKKK